MIIVDEAKSQSFATNKSGVKEMDVETVKKLKTEIKHLQQNIYGYGGTKIELYANIDDLIHVANELQVNIFKDTNIPPHTQVSICRGIDDFVKVLEEINQNKET